jgi:predicted DNA-binding transcriptional regulator YafY
MKLRKSNQPITPAMPAQTDNLKATLSRLSQNEMETIWLGALLTARLADGENTEAARRIVAALEGIRASTIDGKVMVLDLEASDNETTSQALAHHLDIHALRHALIHELKLGVAYIDAKGRATKRIVWPLDVQNYGPNGAMFAWCEKRENFRNFRFDRIIELAIIQQRFEAPRCVMIAFYEALEISQKSEDQR